MALMDNDHLERLMVRGLDEALTEQEQLELNRELIRNPAARRVMEELEGVDRLAAAALEQVLGKEGPPLDVDSLPNPSPAMASRRNRWARWLVPGAVAAALLGLAIAHFPLTPLSETVSENREQPQRMHPTIPSVVQAPQHNGMIRNVNHRAGPRVRRMTGRNAFGVIGEDGNIYWFEVDHSRTIRRPRAKTSEPM